MAQHFLLSPISRSLPDGFMTSLLYENEPLAYALFMLYRWGSLVEQVCPKCGVIDRHTPRPRHKQWRCTGCRADFSLKSGSLLDGTKLPFWKVLTVLYMWMAESKGLSAVAVTRRCLMSYESAYLLLHKFRWAFWQATQDTLLQGEVEIDCVWVLKGIRKANDRRLPIRVARNTARRERLVQKYVKRGMTPGDAQEKARRKVPLEGKGRGSNPKKQPILALVQRGPAGSSRVIGCPIAAESFADVEPIVRRFVAPGTTIYTDFAAAYAGLAASYKLRQINHDELYSDGEGTHTNFVESAFARWRRMEKGTHHKMTARTLQLFFADCAWREDHRRQPPAQRFASALQMVARASICRRFKKYGYEQVDRPNRKRTIHLRLQERVNEPDLRTVSGIAGLLTPAQAGRVNEFLEVVREPFTFASAPAAPVPVRTWDLRRRPGASSVPLSGHWLGAALPGQLPAGYQLARTGLWATAGSA